MKLKRVARSSLAAEVQAFSEGEQELMWCRLQWSEMLGNVVDLAQPQEAVKMVKGILVTDAKSLYDSVTKGDAATSGMGLSDKYSALEHSGGPDGDPVGSQRSSTGGRTDQAPGEQQLGEGSHDRRLDTGG